MRPWLSVRFWLRARLRRTALRNEIDEEMSGHLRAREEELRAGGMPEGEARRAALASFGDMERVRRACRSLYMVDGDEGDGMGRSAWSDVRYAVRGMARQPAFSAAVVLTLGLGIGANSAIFSVLHGVLLEPLPYHDPGELVRLWQADRVNGTRFENFSGPDYFDVAEGVPALVSLAAVEGRSFTLTGAGDEPERITAVAASHELPRLLGVGPALGRWFTADEDAPGGERVVVLGHGAWMTRFGGDRSALGASVGLDGEAHRIVGVADPRVEFPRPGVEFWIPLQIGRESRSRGQHNLAVIARRGDGVGLDRLNGDLAGIAAALEEAYAEDNVGRGMWAQPLRESVVGDASQALYLLAGAVALVLLIACVNVANLLLARGTSREREVAVRLALGAGRGRLVRQLLTEYLVLGGVGGVAGLALALLGVRALRSLAPASLPRLEHVDVDGTVLAFTMGVSLVTGLLCGLLPALEASRTRLRPSLASGAAGGSREGGRPRLRGGLVVVEVALAVVLVSGAGLLLRSVSRLQTVDPGFDPRGVLTASVQLPASRYPQARDAWPDYPEVLAFQDRIVEEVGRLPGVSGVGLAINNPTDAGWTTRFEIEGKGPDEIDPTQEVRIRVISSDYPRTVGMELLRGRLPDRRDDLFASPPVLLINEAMERRYFAGEDPIGRRITNWGTAREVIGVVRDVRFMGLAEPAEPAVYPLFARMPFSAFSILLRTSGDPLNAVAGLRAAVREADPELALGSIATLEAALSASTGQTRFNTLLLTTFAVVSLLLAAVGIYGVIAYGVSQRRREIGVRLSLGATRRDVAGRIVARALGLAGLGVALGLLATIGSSRLLASLLFGVQAFDPSHLAGVVALSLGMAALAAWVPARRASRVDPLDALRGD